MINKSALIDLWQSYRTPIKIVQHEDAGRTINFILTSGSEPIDLTYATVVFYARKPSGEIVYNACTVTDAESGKVLYGITGQTCAEAGMLTCFIEITKSGPSVIRTQNFYMEATPSDDPSGAVESQSEFTALTIALATIETKVSRAGDTMTGHLGFNAYRGIEFTLPNGSKLNLRSSENSNGDQIVGFFKDNVSTTYICKFNYTTGKMSLRGELESLWSGSWSGGSIVVPNSDLYSVFRVPGCMIWKENGTLVGIGGFWHNTYGEYISAFNGTYSGTTWTMENFKRIGHTPGGSHSTAVDLPITKISAIL